MKSPQSNDVYSVMELHHNETLLSDMHLKVSEIDYLFITHAHIDHISRILDLIDAGFDSEIICTHATKALLQLEDGLSFSQRTEKEKNLILKKLNSLS